MSRKLPTLGELEIAVLRLIWQQQPCTERQISDLLQQERPVARTTVLKTMQRLEAKGLLKRLPGESPVRFKAVHDEQRVLPELVRRFVDRVLGGQSNPLVAYLADSERLSDKDVAALEDIARKIDTNREAGDG
jgi:predicted transcriptional regulator